MVSMMPVPAGSLTAMPQPRRTLPIPRDVPWAELRRHAGVVVRWLQAGWNELSADEREDVRTLVTKSRGRPRNLTRDETRRLGRLAGKAAAAAARSGRRR
jgi:hypothetical protein